MTTDEQKQAYLDALARCGVKSEAAREAGVSPATPYRWVEDEAFAIAQEQALEEAADVMETEARRRAIEGVKREKVIGSGENARFIEEQQYSDALLMFMLKAAKPEKFAERSKSELSGPGGKDLGAVDETVAAARIAALLDAARQRKAEGNTTSDDVDPFS